MTAPDDIVSGCVAWLLDQPDIVAALGTTPDGVKPLLFQNDLYRGDIEGSQTTAAYVAHDGGWGAPNEHNTMSFPRITVDILVDPIRGTYGVFDPGEARRRSAAVAAVFDRHLHRPQGGTVWWGTVRTIGCTRLSEPDTVAVTDGDGLLRTHISYGVTQA